MKEEKMLLNMSDPRVGLQEAGRTTERQENAFVELVNTSFKQNNEKPFDLITKEDTIKNVIKAEKFSGRQKSGSEPYTDVKIYTFYERSFCTNFSWRRSSRN